MYADFLPPLGKLCGNAFVAVVCDGMGGAAGGQIASKLAVDSFVSRLTSKLTAFAESASRLSDIAFTDILNEAVQYANAKVYSRSKKDPELYGMGTTLVACLKIKKNIYVVNTGDSRLYAVKGDNIRLITIDHSYVQTLVDSGAITQEEAQSHPDKNIITRAIGIKDDVLCDHFLLSDDVDMLLLCSDGLSNMLEADEILRIVSTPGSITSGASELIRQANIAGGTDNITAILIKL